MARLKPFRGVVLSEEPSEPFFLHFTEHLARTIALRVVWDFLGHKDCLFRERGQYYDVTDLNSLTDECKNVFQVRTIYSNYGKNNFTGVEEPVWPGFLSGLGLPDDGVFCLA